MKKNTKILVLFVLALVPVGCVYPGQLFVASGVTGNGCCDTKTVIVITKDGSGQNVTVYPPTSASSSANPSVSPSSTPTVSVSPSATVSPSASPSVSASPVPSVSPSPSPVVSATPSP